MKVWEGRGTDGGDRERNTDRESMGTPEQIKAMTSSYGKEQEEREKEERRVPIVAHSASRGPSSGTDKNRTMPSQ